MKINEFNKIYEYIEDNYIEDDNDHFLIQINDFPISDYENIDIQAWVKLQAKDGNLDLEVLETLIYDDIHEEWIPTCIDKAEVKRQIIYKANYRK